MQALPSWPSSWHTQRGASIQPVPASTHQAETLYLIGAVEPSHARLKQHVFLQPSACTSPPTSTSLPAQATIVLPPSSPAQELLLPAKVPSDMNLFELSHASARNITNGASVVLLANFDEYNTTRLCMERTSGCGLVLLRCTVQPGNQLWTRMPSGEICVPEYRDQCLHYDPTAVGVNVGEAVRTRSQHWSTLESAQLQLQGANICLGLIAKPNARFLVVGSACSNTTTTLTIAFGHSSAAKLFRPLELQRLHTITSMRQRAAAPPLGGSKDELNDHLSRLSDLGIHVVLRAKTASQDSLRFIDRVSTNDFWACMFVV
jgi:hypothetical protein